MAWTPPHARSILTRRSGSCSGTSCAKELFTKGSPVVGVRDVLLAGVDLVPLAFRVPPQATPAHRSRAPSRVAVGPAVDHAEAQARGRPDDVCDVSRGYPLCGGGCASLHPREVGPSALLPRGVGCQCLALRRPGAYAGPGLAPGAAGAWGSPAKLSLRSMSFHAVNPTTSHGADSSVISVGMAIVGYQFPLQPR